jgi:hypothetical protein
MEVKSGIKQIVEYLMTDVLEGKVNNRIRWYGQVLGMNRNPRKALNMKLNENAQGDGLIPRREHHVRKDIIQKEGITCEEASEGK